MKFIKTYIDGLYIIEPKLWEDERGHFYESYNKQLFEEAGIIADFVQDNESLSNRGVVRGLHAQRAPFAQGKLMRVVQGKVMDIVVDIRKHSPTFGQYVRVELSSENRRMFWVPPGFLHGFAALVDHTIFNYKVTSLYDKASEVGVVWNDPDLNIDWGITDQVAHVSEKDKLLPRLKEIEAPF